MQVQH